MLDGNHAFGATAVAGVFADVGALAVAVFSGGQHALSHRVVAAIQAFSVGHQHGNHTLAIFQVHAAHATCIAAHGAHIVFVKAHGLACVREQHHVVLAVGQRCANQVVAFVQAHGNDAGLARVAEFVQSGLLHGAHAGGHEDVVVFREAAVITRERQHHVDLFAFLQREHVDDGAATRVARTRGNFPDLEPVHAATVGEAQQVVVRVRNEQLVNPVVFLGLCGLLAAATTLLGAVFRQRLALDVAGVRERHHHVGGGDQVFGGQVLCAVLDGRAASANLVLTKFSLELG